MCIRLHGPNVPVESELGMLDEAVQERRHLHGHVHIAILHVYVFEQHCWSAVSNDKSVLVDRIVHEWWHLHEDDFIALL